MAAIGFPTPSKTSPATPALGIGVETFMVGSRATSAGLPITGVAMAASSAYVSAGVVNVADARFLTVYAAYNAHASTTTGRYSLLVLASPVVTEPAATDDVWYPICSTDGSITATALAGALPANMDFTATPSWGRMTVDRLDLAPRAVSANSDKRRDKFQPINVASDRWIQILYSEVGDTTNRGTIAISVVGTI